MRFKKVLRNGPVELSENLLYRLIQDFVLIGCLAVSGLAYKTLGGNSFLTNVIVAGVSCMKPGCAKLSEGCIRALADKCVDITAWLNA